jgi:glycosyltransferase involved in cell wall biosynthesis
MHRYINNIEIFEIKILIFLKKNIPKRIRAFLIAFIGLFSQTLARRIVQAPDRLSKLSENSGVKEKTHENLRDTLPNGCNILFITCDIKSASHEYRVENPFRWLTKKGVQGEIIQLHELHKVINRCDEFSFLYLWRVALGDEFFWNKDLLHIIELFKIAGSPVIYDTDDLVFEPDIVSEELIDGIRFLSEVEKRRYVEGVRGFNRALSLADVAFVTTPELSRRASKYVPRVIVIPNGLDERYSSAINWKLVKAPRDKKIIGYTPGSLTHQKDFLECYQALVQVLSERDDAIFIILGKFEMDEFPDLKRFMNSKVFTEDTVGRERVFSFYQNIDINISPLEQNNPFTSSKSNLKFYEPAIFEVPTVASPTEPFALAIKDGINGFLASNVEDWIIKINLLLDSEETRLSLGAAAKKYVINEYSGEKIGEKIIDSLLSYKLGIGESNYPNLELFDNEKLVINFLIHGLIVGGGGHRNILRIAHYLSNFGHKIRLYFYDTNLNEWTIKSLIWKNFYPINCEVKVYKGELAASDVTFCTFWKTVYDAEKHAGHTKNLVYLVQDFEPMFYGVGSEYIMSEETYKKGIYCITSGPWCANLLKKKYNARADYFNFPIESVYLSYGKKLDSIKKRIIFFAKPEMPRRCYEIGIQVLELVNRMLPDVEIILFGSNQVVSDQFSFPVVCKGVLPTTQDLADLYNSATIGMVFSPTNPSLVPYEMMACGLPVVDLKLSDDCVIKYGGSEDVAYLVEPSPAKIAKVIIRALLDSNELNLRSTNGISFIKENFPDEEEMCRKVESYLLANLNSGEKNGY